MDIYERKMELEAEGYVEVETDSGTGSFVLVNRSKSLAAKVNQDTAYNHFADFAQAHAHLQVPTINKVEKFGSEPYEGDAGFTVILMKELFPLRGDESNRYAEWIEAYWQWKRGDGPEPPDNFGLIQTLDELAAYAAKVGVNLDVNKATNIMKDGCDNWIVLDPFN